LRGREDWVHGTAGALLDVELLPVTGANPAVATPFTALGDGIRLVFVNGMFAAELSACDNLPAGAVVKSLGTGREAPAFGTGMQDEETALGALNGLFWRDGLHLELPAGLHLARPVELHFINDLAGAAGLVPVRNLIQLGEGSKATVIERFHLADPGVVEQPLTEVICGVGAEVDHIKLIGGASAGEHYGATHVMQGADSVYRSWEIVTGGARARRELHLGLRGTGARCDLNALYMGTDHQRFDLRTRVHHEAAGCETRELYKGVLDGHARGVFDGLIRVARDSQQTNAHQTNRNLLLSDDAVVNSIPRLEIYADDVKCSHGSTTGQLDDEQIFYLRTRGFSPAEARGYLAWAFASEVVDTLPVAGLRAELADLVARSLDGTALRLDRECVG
jgi:Fe-S cluster assembly protein SufD